MYSSIMREMILLWIKKKSFPLSLSLSLSLCFFGCFYYYLMLQIWQSHEEEAWYSFSSCKFLTLLFLWSGFCFICLVVEQTKGKFETFRLIYWLFFFMLVWLLAIKYYFFSSLLFLWSGFCFVCLAVGKMKGKFDWLDVL
jgi:hypothetical protein